MPAHVDVAVAQAALRDRPGSCGIGREKKIFTTFGSGRAIEEVRAAGPGDAPLTPGPGGRDTTAELGQAIVGRVRERRPDTP